LPKAPVASSDTATNPTSNADFKRNVLFIFSLA